MSDTNPNPNDSAIAVLREHVRELDADLLRLNREADVQTACRDKLLVLIEELSRKPRAARKARPADCTDVTLPVLGKMNIDNPADPMNKALDLGPRPSVFAPPGEEAA